MFEEVVVCILYYILANMLKRCSHNIREFNKFSDGFLDYLNMVRILEGA